MCLEIEAVTAANSIQMFLAQRKAGSPSRASRQFGRLPANNRAGQRRAGERAGAGVVDKGTVIRGDSISALDTPLVVAFFSLLVLRLFRKCLKHKRRALRLKDCQLVEWVAQHCGGGGREGEKGTQWRRNKVRCRKQRVC